MRTVWALMVMPRSRSRSMASSTWACISRAVRLPVSSSRRSESVDLPWSMCAMIAKLRLFLAGCTPTETAGAPAAKPKQATAPALPAAAPVQAQPPAPPPPTAEELRVRAIIAQVEAAYARGTADYQKGMLAEAKVEFDRAVDLMLASGIDIRNTPQLQDEFDKIVDQVNALEMEALKQGNGFVPKAKS
jgi:membrane-bound lytic murein transglycosylase D